MATRPTPQTSEPGPDLLQVGAIAKSGSDNSPAFRNAAYSSQADAWQLLNDCYGGTVKLWDRMETYFPKGLGERPARWRARVKGSRFFNAVESTVHGCTGLVMRKPVALGKDASPSMRAMAENIDGRGTHLEVFARELFELGFLHGHAGILVDAPPAPNLGRKPTKADAKALGRRPFFITYRAEQIINFRLGEMPDGREYVRLLVLAEVEVKDVGLFGQVAVPQFRVFRCDEAGVVTFEVWEEIQNGTDKGNYRMMQQGGVANVKEVPFVGFYAGRRVGWFQSRSPVYALAEQNLDLHTVQIDHRFAMSLTNRPTMVRKGGKAAKGNDVAVGGEEGIDLPLDAVASVTWLEAQGHGLAHSREEMVAITSRIASLGLQMMAPETRSAETAQAKILDQADTDSRLAVAARALQDALEQASVYAGQMMGEDGASFKVSLDLSGLTLDAAKIATYSAMVEKYQLTLDTFWSILQEGGALPSDFNPEKEAAALDEAAARAIASEPGAEDTKDDDGADTVGPDGKPLEPGDEQGTKEGDESGAGA